MKDVVDGYGSHSYAALTESTQLLSGMLNQKLFKPLHRELECRKEVCKVLADRRKVKADYDAYRRKQLLLVQGDPANSHVYAKNLDNAQATFDRHSQVVAKQLAAVADERDTALREAFMAFVLTQVDFYGSMHNSVSPYAHASAFGDAPTLAASWQSVEQLLVHGKASIPPPERVLPKELTDPCVASSVAVKSRPHASRLDTCTRLADDVKPDMPVPKDLILDESMEEEKRQQYLARATTAPEFSCRETGSSEIDLLSGCCSAPIHVAASSASPEQNTVVQVSGNDCIDLPQLGECPRRCASDAGGVSVSSLDLMDGEIGSLSSAMDDMFQLGAAQPLMPTTSTAPSFATTRSVPSAERNGKGNGLCTVSVGLDAGGYDLRCGINERSREGNAPAPAAESTLLGGLDDVMSDFCSTNSCGTTVDAKPVGDCHRAFFAQRREQQKRAAIDAKVEQLRVLKETEETNRELERGLEKAVKARVQEWQKEKKNLRALLASLHEIAPPCAWKALSLAELLDHSAVKKAYRKALLAVHPDKQATGDIESKVLAQHIFDALRDAWNLFEKIG